MVRSFGSASAAVAAGVDLKVVACRPVVAGRFGKAVLGSLLVLVVLCLVHLDLNALVGGPMGEWQPGPVAIKVI